MRQSAILCVAMVSASCAADIGRTTVEKWPDGKRAAISITYDGGTINQFDVALPIMNELGLPATFFIVTGDIEGSQYHRSFIGRPVDEILAEVVSGVPTTTENFFERASAVRMLPYQEAVDFHTRAGDLFELGKLQEAYHEVEEGFRQAASGRLTRLPGGAVQQNPDITATWDELRTYAGQGHEFASHSVSHAQLATLDDPNLAYELEKSREEILSFLGPAHTFSIECPYGTENERVVRKALSLYQASRNRMPAEYLDEVNRWSDADPAASANEYVQWQRGPRSATSMAEMKTWVDRILARDNVWLVLVFHGVEGIGWEPKSEAELDAYFRYIADHVDLWVATFRDVTRYMRERMSAQITSERSGGEIRVSLTHSLDPDVYDYPLSLATRVPEDWDFVEVIQGSLRDVHPMSHNGAAAFVRYTAVPDGEVVILREAPSH